MTHALQHLGLRHVALFVRNFEATLKFYCDILKMKIEWQPDADNIYLTSGADNLALHRAPSPEFAEKQEQRLDHIGFILRIPEDVDAWHALMQAEGVEILTAPKTHRDGARSFYCLDPDGNRVQMIFHPPISLLL